MHLVVQEDGGLVFRDVPEGLYDQLMLLPKVCDSESNPEAGKRLNPSPVAEDVTNEELRQAIEQDWNAYVQPGLEAARLAAVDAVMKDLKRARRDDDEEGQAVLHFEVAADHLEPWCHALNIARLTMAEKFRLPFSAYPLKPGKEIPLARLAAAHLSDIYAQLQEYLVRAMAGMLDDDGADDFD